MVRAFHWQYGDILLAIYIFFVFTYYFVLSLKNKYTILYYTNIPRLRVACIGAQSSAHDSVLDSSQVASCTYHLAARIMNINDIHEYELCLVNIRHDT